MNKQAQRIKKIGIETVEKRDYKDTEFPVLKKGYHKNENKTNFSIIMLGYENKQAYLIY